MLTKAELVRVHGKDPSAAQTAGKNSFNLHTDRYWSRQSQSQGQKADRISWRGQYEQVWYRQGQKQTIRLEHVAGANNELANESFKVQGLNAGAE